jgi:hypothetical protein
MVCGKLNLETCRRSQHMPGNYTNIAENCPFSREELESTLAYGVIPETQLAQRLARIRLMKLHALGRQALSPNGRGLSHRALLTGKFPHGRSAPHIQIDAMCTPDFIIYIHSLEISSKQIQGL